MNLNTWMNQILSLFWLSPTIIIPRQVSKSMIFQLKIPPQVDGEVSIEPMMEEIKLLIWENYESGNRDQYLLILFLAFLAYQFSDARKNC